MFRTRTKGSSPLLAVTVSTACFTFLLASASVQPAVLAQKRPPAQQTAQQAPRPSVDPGVVRPVYAGYKGVTLGMKADEARAKLGTPRDKSDTDDYYVFSDSETAQVLYDSDHTVRVISVNYIGENAGAPSAREVLGEDIEPRPDGSAFKLVRYPKAGCFISYNRTVGGNPMVIITMQKIPIED